jgi:hypothetical protein
MRAFLRSGRKLWRTTFGRDTAVERFLRWRYGAMFRRGKVELKYALFSSAAERDNRIGIFMKGGCDLVAVFFCEPLIRHVLQGTCCMMLEGAATDSRSDFVLQTLRELPQEWLEPVTKKLKLRDDHFQTQLFKDNMRLPGKNVPREFPKSVVILSIGSDLIRTLYRDRQHGFLVDPGGWWLNQDLNEVLNDLSVADWFRKNFVSVGKISVEDFAENFTEIVRRVKNETQAPVLVFNNLAVEPGSLVHNYQFIKNHHVARRRAFNVALAELSRKFDFHIVDIDRLLKRAGVSAMVDFAHYPTELSQPVAQETFRIMKDLGVFS